VARRGHEVASKGYDQRSPVGMSADELRDDLARAREAIERASGAPVLGYRAPGWLPPYEHDRGAALLAGEGYAYGASVKPFGRAFSGREWAAPRRLVYGARGIWEIPVSSVRIAGLALPVGAANYTRQLPPG
jgi:peptidoglycan/xylan/chitin deacetylase (PgdA/CDA1 family)